MKSADRILRVLHEYRGLPLTAHDLSDELGISSKAIAKTARQLAEEGVIRAWRDPNAHPGNAHVLYATRPPE